MPFYVCTTGTIGTELRLLVFIRVEFLAGRIFSVNGSLGSPLAGTSDVGSSATSTANSAAVKSQGVVVQIKDRFPEFTLLWFGEDIPPIRRSISALSFLAIFAAVPRKLQSGSVSEGAGRSRVRIYIHRRWRRCNVRCTWYYFNFAQIFGTALCSLYLGYCTHFSRALGNNIRFGKK